MSSVTVVILLMALGLGQLWIYVAMDKSLFRETDAIQTGVTGHGGVSIKYLWMRLGTRWVGFAGAIISFNLVCAIGYALIARHLSVEEVRLFAYLLAFTSLAVALTWATGSPLWYLHLRSVLRQAEAD